MPAELHIHEITAVAPHADGSKIVVKARTVQEDARAELEIAVTTELAPAIALALLASTAKARASRDDLEPALDVLAAGVVRSSTGDKIRLQLLFDKGVVLPLELPIEAGHALNDALTEYLSSPKRRLARRRTPAPV